MALQGSTGTAGRPFEVVLKEKRACRQMKKAKRPARLNYNGGEEETQWRRRGRVRVWSDVS